LGEIVDDLIKKGPEIIEKEKTLAYSNKSKLSK